MQIDFLYKKKEKLSKSGWWYNYFNLPEECSTRYLIAGPPLPVTAAAVLPAAARLSHHHTGSNLGSLVAGFGTFAPRSVGRPFTIN